MKSSFAFGMFALVLVLNCGAEGEPHSHPAPEKLGRVSFPTTCRADVQPQFNRALALLHSFTYTDAERAFRGVLDRDATCSIARWGIAMSLYHQLWEPPSGADLREGQRQIQIALEHPPGSAREHRFVEALNAYYSDADAKSADERAQRYAEAMHSVAEAYPRDSEAQIFYALALIATASPSDKSHAYQKRAVEILEPIFRAQPQHPGVAHYLIHAYDSAELAPRGLAAARAYAKIAPSAPHALHMPSHIFTRMGFWDDSIASNLAARAAARAGGDTGEELHAMDYLTYAYLQRDRVDDARRVVADLNAMDGVDAAQFKMGYAATAMPVRLIVERSDWDGATKLEPLPHSAPHVVAIVYWARALGQAHRANTAAAQEEIAKLQDALKESRAKGNAYWTHQVEILLAEAQAWQLAASGNAADAIAKLRSAAEDEDAVEKLPVTPGPIVPAREQLGQLLLAQQRYADALREFRTALTQAPRRRGSLLGAMAAAEKLGDAESVKQLRAELSPASRG